RTPGKRSGDRAGERYVPADTAGGRGEVQEPGRTLQLRGAGAQDARLGRQDGNGKTYPAGKEGDKEHADRGCLGSRPAGPRDDGPLQCAEEEDEREQGYYPDSQESAWQDTAYFETPNRL